MPSVRPYGTWTSPLRAQDVASAAIRISQITIYDAAIYWAEGRPHESGRSVVVRRRTDGVIEDVTPAGTNVRSRVHEYGGAAYAVVLGAILYSEFTDQRVYLVAGADRPVPLTPAGRWQYADYTVDPRRSRVVCVREDHSLADREAVTTLVSLPLDGSAGSGTVIASGYDFYSTPRFSPGGRHLSWLAWRHPQMPWDGTELFVADILPDGALAAPVHVAGGSSESVFQPGWSPDGTLYFVSDRTGWWNLYRFRNGDIESVRPLDAEFGRPQWTLGSSTWAFADDRRLVAACGRHGRWHLTTIDVETLSSRDLATTIEPGDSVAATRTHAITLGGSPGRPDALVRIDLATGDVDRLREMSDVEIPAGLPSVAEAIEFPSSDGQTARAFYYRPHNPAFTGPSNERPPLLVMSHGGPTAAAYARLNLVIQYWTSRGFAVVDVNYRGSAGFGREYRRQLNGRWGIADVEDCVRAAAFLAERGDADGHRLLIRGNSAGGYTTLAALTFKPGIFAAGASYYGIGDLEQLALHTHKFESRYLDGLIGAYPDARDIYRERSPIHAIDRLAAPVIFFQGLEDRVVPPEQSRMMADAVRDKGLPVALLTFEHEQHGFRHTETIVRCLEAELFFYGFVLGFTPAGDRPPLAIANRPV